MSETKHTPKLCPDCGRRPSEAIGAEGDLAVRGGWRPSFATDRCPDAFHDVADAAPEMYEALKESRFWVATWPMMAASTARQQGDLLTKLDAALAKADGVTP